ncbi:hypothetical protein JCM17846_29520 [Iodidimonas nitroreducens]|uniref:GGDEF-domain containing protein n=1 Tax=Iodidimonas nitroreducens TaxID=1236968 RepID=A0A5A7NCR5_9PROT|nr:phosphodiesterase [Iodidimonas nitroreducens]GER05270.1 hypothetical protein JCM17846_29520 [Iodidimonas nitroreducens]
MSQATDERSLCLVIFDLDRFKRVISQYGSDQSHALLQACLLRVRQSLANIMVHDDSHSSAKGKAIPAAIPVPILGQLSDKEFAVLLPGDVDKSINLQKVEAILRQISVPIKIAERSVYLSASAGVAMAPKDADQAGDLLSAAHSAVRMAKRIAGNSVVFCTPQLAANEARTMETENRLREAIAGNELEMYFQPQASVRTGDVVGVEALVRWHHPDLGLMSPESFIAIAEEAGITAELGCWAIQSAIAEICRMERHGLPPLQLSVNVSADMFTGLSGRDLVAHVRQALVREGMAPQRLTLEITERSIIDENGNGPQVIDALKALGVKLALDDFGTGYSSLSYLKALPIDELKIDKTFIMGNAKEDRAFLRAIIMMAKTLNMSVLAEGVETRDQLVRLYEEGCDLYQGYLCSPPVPAHALADVIKTRFPGTSNPQADCNRIMIKKGHSR